MGVGVLPRAPARNQVFIFDTTTNRLVQTMTVEDAPFEIAFTDTEAYIRRRDSEAVTLVPLAPLRAEGHAVGHGEFPAGEKPVAATTGDTLAASMVAAPGEPAMLLASPAGACHPLLSRGDGGARPTVSTTWVVSRSRWHLSIAACVRPSAGPTAPSHGCRGRGL